MRFYTKVKIGIVLLICVALFLSCGGKVTTRTEEPEYEFTVNGVVVKDLNTGKDIAYFAILRNGNPYDSVLIKVGSDTLENQGNGNYYLDGFPLFDHGQNISINVSSFDNDFNLNTSVQMPGLFQITEINHTTITSALADKVKIYFSTSTGASGYFKSIVRPDGSDGYTALIPAIEIGQTAIDADAFYDGATFVTGTYKINLIAYRNSFLYYPGMEFYLPAGLPADNLSGANGTVGAGVLAPVVSIDAE